MTQMQNASLLPKKTAIPKRRVNWHEAASCAVQIELRDYAALLDFQPEFTLGKNSFRIDLLVIKKITDQPILKNIARIFKKYNLFEIKGISSSVTITAYYKTIGYACLLITRLNNNGTEQYSAPDISITLLAFRFPRKLVKHLRKERKLTVAKISPGIYDISKEIFKVQIIVTCELPSDENLYLRCLTDHLQDASLISRLADDYAMHQDQDIYIRFLNQLTAANLKTKGASSMVCEGLFNLFGTSSEEIIAQAKQESRVESDAYYLPKIDELSSSNEMLASSNRLLSSANVTLSSQIDYLKHLLKQNNISFNINEASLKTDVPVNTDSAEIEQ